VHSLVVYSVMYWILILEWSNKRPPFVYIVTLMFYMDYLYEVILYFFCYDEYVELNVRKFVKCV
jgi:hypothetical protein